MKKIYQTPSISIVRLKPTSIICTSTMDIKGEAESYTVVESRRQSLWDVDVRDGEE